MLLKAEHHRGFQHLRRRPHFSPSGPSAAMEFGKEAEERVLSALRRSERQQQRQHHSSSSSSSRWGEWADWGPCSRSCGEGLQVTQMGLPEKKRKKSKVDYKTFSSSSSVHICRSAPGAAPGEPEEEEGATTAGDTRRRGGAAISSSAKVRGEMK